ncbi:MAG: DUF190 domain-containing protein [Deltaproteobacteria bacterium]|nr:DUF190 domain-containing protein [Deltaproteobacteria bacterium]MBK8234281.1 DUF190 domain-containing protein [Deltaproteobacteria bacterium]MBK8715000.1 DUF190 domain-containing protein [Deltaproteobacteria bacterium]MBP7290454.1 DUF190 domain-containing protein [Nannocystaceae bacterium]
MDKREALLVRVYLTERRARVNQLLQHLHDDHGVRGVTVFDARAGLGHTAREKDSLASIEGKSIVLEFFEAAPRAKEILAVVRSLVAPRHVVMMPVTLLEG